MCGIAGFVSPSLGQEHLKAMTDRLAHRGPDGEGFARFEGAMLGHRRLAVIDLDTGRQPMTSPCAPLTIVFNGEIYNYRELRPALEAKGHRFATRSDTEVILHLYEEKGTACVEDLRGMFAFAIWDDALKRLFAARDRLGVKPFVYRLDADGTFAFASEIKAILALPGVPREPDPEALSLFLAFQYVPHPWTAFRGIRKLPPGHTLFLEDGRLDIRPYWRLEPGEPPTGDLEEAIRERLLESTRLRLVSDVPLGAFLSGGVDSSGVVAAMSRLQGARPRTFAIGFEDRAFDELAHARRVARHLGTDHAEEVVRPDAAAILPKLAWHFDEPFADASALPTYWVSRHARRHVTVALTGDGGDEAFGGYVRYRANLALERWGTPTRGLAFLAGLLPGEDEKSLGRRARRLLEVAGQPAMRRYARWVAFFDPGRREALLASPLGGLEPFDWLEREAEATGFRDLLSRMEALDYRTYLPGDILTKVDLASMAVSLECRSPFLDHALVAFAMRIPPCEKASLLSGKRCLKRALAPWLPAATLRRGKMGFGVPVGRWLRGPLQPLLRNTVLSSRALQRGLFKPEAVRTMVEDHVAGRAHHGPRLWALLVLELWHRTWIDGGEKTGVPSS